jgi:hypothetical protein
VSREGDGGRYEHTLSVWLTFEREGGEHLFQADYDEESQAFGGFDA